MTGTDYRQLALRIVAKQCDMGYSVCELADLLHKLGARAMTTARGAYLAHEGDPVRHIGFVLEGTLHVSAAGLGGEAHLMRAVRPGEFVGASLIFKSAASYPADVMAFSDSEVVVFEVCRLLAWRSQPDSWRFFDELGRQLGAALVASWQKAAVLSCPNIAERVMLYLAIRSREERSETITVPGTEADFANYLGVNSAALSRVLNKLRKEGRLSYRRNMLTRL